MTLSFSITTSFRLCLSVNLLRLPLIFSYLPHYKTDTFASLFHPRPLSIISVFSLSTSCILHAVLLFLSPISLFLFLSFYPFSECFDFSIFSICLSISATFFFNFSSDFKHPSSLPYNWVPMESIAGSIYICCTECGKYLVCALLLGSAANIYIYIPPPLKRIT